MKAVTWHGRRDMRVEEVPDPTIKEADDAIIKITSTGLCGSDLHLYETLGPFMTPGDVVGHEPMGIVQEVGPDVTNLKTGDRVVVPFNVCCGSCWMCEQQLYSQCETTQNHEYGTGASFFGYSKLYGHSSPDLSQETLQGRGSRPPRTGGKGPRGSGPSTQARRSMAKGGYVR